MDTRRAEASRPRKRGLPASGGLFVPKEFDRDYRFFSLASATVLLAAAPVFLSLPAVLPVIDGIVPFLAGVASFYLGLQFYCGDLADA